nr:hypothetical protein [Rathayibacter sp. AY1F3]
MATVVPPAAAIAHASPTAAIRRTRASRGDCVTSTRPSRVSTVSASAPPTPGHQAILGAGHESTARAIEAIHQAGTAASRIAASAAPGHQGASRQPMSPSPVAAGAAGSASRLASTPYTGTDGSTSSSTGWQASCAAVGTASSRARGPGSTRPRAPAIGSASSRSPAVARTDSTKPSLPAIEGSAATSTTTVASRAGTAAPERRPSRARRTTVAITAARTTLGSGVTSTTKPASRARAATVRRRRPAPRSAAIVQPATTTTAQLAPETAVRWVSDAVRIASSSPASSADVSPVARPGRSPATSPPTSAARSRKRERSTSATAAAPPGPRRS